MQIFTLTDATTPYIWVYDLKDSGTPETSTADEAYVRESILTPTAKMVNGYPPLMPTFQGVVSEEQIAQLTAYVKSLATAPAAPGAGTPAPAPAGAPAATPQGAAH